MAKGVDSRWVTKRMASRRTVLSALAFVATLAALATGCSPYALEGPAEPSVSILEEAESGGIVLLASARLAEPAEVIGILDVQLPHGEQQRGLEELAFAAAELGADAVVGVELTHGEGKGPMHLSGLAVRVLR